MSNRVRFAPSPTGFLHIGGVRTALFNWLWAKHRGGKYLLRIEDTDLERSEKRYTDDILACLDWLGMASDEPIVYQSARLEHYRGIAEEWVRKGLAYYCVCSEADVEQMRERALAAGRKPKYDGTCRELAHRTGAIRAKLPLDGGIAFDDLIHGSVSFQNADLDDFVIVRSTGAPTYNFTVVVDDVEMRITDIIRGDDHINNTPKQVHLYRALGAPVPRFAHLPMILGTDKKKLSKRHGDVSASVYREQGYLPVAILNFLVRLGWSHGDQEVFTVEEMIRFFDFEKVQKSAAVFNPEKLLWLNGAHLRAMPARDLRERLRADFPSRWEDLPVFSTDHGLRLIEHVAPKVKLLPELVDQLVPLCGQALPDVSALASGLRWHKNPSSIAGIKGAVAELTDHLSGLAPKTGPLESAGVERSALESWVKALCERRQIKLGDLAEPVRLSVAGRLVSIGLYEVLLSLPWELLEPRLRRIQEL